MKSLSDMGLDIYAQNIIDHYKNPRNFGVIKGAQVKHCEANYSCGDKLSITFNLDKKDRIVDFKFEGSGCAISQAAMSIVSDLVIGKTKAWVLKMELEDVKKVLGVPISESRYRCAILGLVALKNALKK